MTDTTEQELPTLQTLDQFAEEFPKQLRERLTIGEFRQIYAVFHEREKLWATTANLIIEFRNNAQVTKIITENL